MTMFTTAIPVWVNVTCGNGHHEDRQLNPETTLPLQDFRCSECGSEELAKVNISGADNEHMTTLEQVRKH